MIAGAGRHIGYPLGLAPELAGLSALTTTVLGINTLYYGNFLDPDVTRWSNIGFFDNYYEEVADKNSHLTFNPDGRSRPDADIDLKLDGRSGFARYLPDEPFAGPHGRVTNWYAGTIDLSVRAIKGGKITRNVGPKDDFDGDFIYRALFDKQYRSILNVPPMRYDLLPWYLGFERESNPGAAQFNDKNAIWEGIGEGWYWSVLGGGFQSNNWGTDPKTDNTEYDHTDSPQRRDAVPAVFNGDFDQARCIGNRPDPQRDPRLDLSRRLRHHERRLIPVHQRPRLRKQQLRHEAGQQLRKLTYNRFLIPPDAEYLSWKWTSTMPATTMSSASTSTRRLQSLELNSAAWVIPTINLSRETDGFHYFYLPLPPLMRGQISTLTFEVSAPAQ